jgi:hypothetical protein
MYSIPRYRRFPDRNLPILAPRDDRRNVITKRVERRVDEVEDLVATGRPVRLPEDRVCFEVGDEGEEGGTKSGRDEAVGLEDAGEAGILDGSRVSD